MSELGTSYKLAPVGLPDEETGSFSGYASVFHFLDYHGDIIVPGAYKDDIARFMEKGFIGGVGHDHINPIGKPKQLYEDAKGLFLEAQLIGTGKAQEARQMIVSRVVQELSVGIMPLQVKRLATKREVLEYWDKSGWDPSDEEMARAESGARLIKRAKLLEVSPVALAANERTQITSFKAASSDALLDVFSRLGSIEARLEAVEAAVARMSESSEDEDEVEDYAEVISGFRKFLGES